jgi:hypothetical protein
MEHDSDWEDDGREGDRDGKGDVEEGAEFRLGQLAFLSQSSDLGADENGQMADFGIDGVEDPLAAFP